MGYTRGQVRGQWDERLLTWLRLRTELGLWLVTQPSDADKSPFALSAYLGADFKTTTRTRFTLGVMYWNSDAHEVVVKKGADGYAQVERVRSHAFWPTVDYIWSW